MTSPPPYGQYPPPYGAPPLGTPQYGAPQYPYPQAPRPTNGLAVASLICAFLFAPLAIVFGHLSLSQIKRSGEEGRGLAIAGLVMGYLFTGLAVVALVVGIVFFAWMARELEDVRSYGQGYPDYSPTVTAFPSDIGDLPMFTPPAGLGANCAYPATPKPASKPATPPRAGKVPTDPAIVDATMVTNLGPVGLRLDNGKSPCTVNSFASLAQQGFFDGTSCHRLTANNTLSVLQCGDPTGTGAGGPGYSFANEYPTTQYPTDAKELTVPLRYPRGTLAMASPRSSAGIDGNGSQFFIVYADSKLPPTYTVFGSVDETGLAVIDRIATAGVTGGNKDGKPALPVTITSLSLD